jgi:UDP-N-acetylmuramoylalanine--D-glutamate ligase
VGQRQGILILGAGRSGQAAARLLLNDGRPLRLADEGGLPGDLPPELESVDLRGGEFAPDWLTDIDLLVLSPGVPPESPTLRAAQAAGIRISGELEEAYRRCPRPLLAVTGSNGKSTVTALAGHLLAAQGIHAPAGGNLGRPLSELLVEEPTAELYVVEVSSFQAETFERFRPAGAALLNLSPDHLDRYPDLEAYYGAKLRCFAAMTAEDRLVLGEDPELENRLAGCPARRLPFLLERRPLAEEEATFLHEGMLCTRLAGEESSLVAAAELPLVGRHNLSNALAALALVLPFGADPVGLAKGLREFRGLAHRMEDLGELAGLRCVNDSKATNVEASVAGLAGLDASLLLIAGGKDKGGDFAAMAAALPRVRIAYGIGEAGPDIARAFGERGRELPDLAAALAAARAEGREGEILLLSPACASYDQYRNFEERGDHFRRLIEEARA